MFQEVNSISNFNALIETIKLNAKQICLDNLLTSIYCLFKYFTTLIIDSTKIEELDQV
jgi:hypothetical protein